MPTLSGTVELERKLLQIAEKMKGELAVGFLEGATYPDGTPVPAVAFWDEFGRPEVGQPPRPFFRQMIADESATWGPKLAKMMKGTNLDAGEALAVLGEDIKGALQQSINNLTSPPLAPSTIKAKGFPKPLIDTGQTLNSVGYEVKP